MIVGRRVETNHEEEHEKETLDFEKPDFVFHPSGFHNYRQQGYYLVCKSCEISHAIWIGPDKILVGFDDKGQAIIKNRKEVMR
jgi:hypothetical protein